MLSKYGPAFPSSTHLLVEGDAPGGERQLSCWVSAVLVKQRERFFAGKYLPFLLLLSAASGCEGQDMNTLAKEPRSVVLGEHPNGVSCVVFSPDGKILVSGGSDGTAQIWNVASLKNLRVLEWREHIWSVAFSPVGSLLATGTSQKSEDRKKFVSAVVLWKVDTGESLTVLKGEPFTNPAFSVAFSPDGQTLAVGSMRAFDTRRCTVPLWEVPEGKLRRTLVGGMGLVYSVQFSPDGKLLATGGLSSDENTKTPSFKLWDVATGKLKTDFKGLKVRVHSVAFSPDGKLLASGGGFKDITEVALWDVGEGMRRATLTGHQGYVYSVTFSHDGKLLASAGGDPFYHKAEIILWDVKTLKAIIRLEGHKDFVKAVAFSPDDTMLASGSQDGSVRLWYLRGHPPVKNKKDR